jgi:PEGA domain
MKASYSIGICAFLFVAASISAQETPQSPPPVQAEPANPKLQVSPATPPAAAAFAVPRGFVLEDGTPVKLRTTRELSSATETTGQIVDFEVTEEVKVNNVVVIPQGGIAWGSVVAAQPKRRMGRGGKLDITIDRVRLSDGEKVALRAVKNAQGGGHVGAMTTGMVVTGVLFFPVAPLFLFMHGKDITIPKGTEVTAYISSDASLEPARFGVSAPAIGQTSGAQEGMAAGAKASTAENAPEAVPAPVKIESTPDGAEITVDSKLMGTTPSTLRLIPGSYIVKLSKPGFNNWVKVVVVVSDGMTTVRATLEPQ